MDFQWLTIYEASERILQGELSPVELTRACLEQVERFEPQVNAFITLTPELALEQARQAEAEIRGGQVRGALHGIPLALKDLYETEGLLTTAGARFYREYVPAADADVVTRLRRAGMVLLGKLNMHEIALGVTNENPHYGECHNPWDLGRIPGGSSGGSGAALAAGFCLGSMGSDTGGSIRIPASLCGIVGLKPTYGRLSKRGVVPLSWHLDHAGPMARCVRDVALLLQATAGYDPGDPYSQHVPVEDYWLEIDSGVRGWRVALASGDSMREVDADVWAAVESASRLFADLGAVVERVEVPDLAAAAQANGVMLTADAAQFHREHLENAQENFSADIQERLHLGAGRTLSEYIQARRVQAGFRRKLDALFTSYDLLLLPSTPVPALPLDREQAVGRAPQLTRFTAPFNLAGLPALSLPCGFVTRDGKPLPVGLQLVRGAWGEAGLLCAGLAYEQAAGWHLQPPGFAASS